MGFKFRRSIKILPGVRVNISKSGVSTSVGTRGAHVTVGHGKIRETVGLPGTGLSYTQSQPSTRMTAAEGARATQSSEGAEPFPGGKAWRSWLFVALLVITAVVIAFTVSG